MVVRNIYVSDKEYFLEFLIRDLIKYGISYCLVKEADEVHFDNYIIRFHFPYIKSFCNRIFYII